MDFIYIKALYLKRKKNTHIAGHSIHLNIFLMPLDLPKKNQKRDETLSSPFEIIVDFCFWKIQ